MKKCNQNDSEDNKMDDVLNAFEKKNVELKKAENSVPKSLYETLSAFANTDGGIIYLGVIENSPQNIVVGISNEEQYKKDILNTIHNKTKFSYPLLSDDNFETLTYENKKVLKIIVPEAPKNVKPVYLNGSISESYGRSNDGDYPLTKNQIKYYLNDNNDDSYDSLPNIKEYSFDDVNKATLNEYRAELNSVYPNNIYSDLNDRDFLVKTGILINNEQGKQVLTNAGVLLLTDYSKIVTVFPSYLLDYQRNVTGNSKWDNRIVSDEPTWSGNLFDFYQMVFKDLYSDIPSSYVSINGQNVGKALMIDCFKEALANAFSNHSFFLNMPLKIIRTIDSLSITNSGKMRIGKEQAINGGISIPRNHAIITFFRRIGVADKSGTGIPKMYDAMKKNGYLNPIIIESSYPEENTTLILKFTYSKNDSLPEIEQEVMDVIGNAGNSGVSVAQVAQALKISRQYASTVISSLANKNMIVDNGKATKGKLYYLNAK